MKSIFASKTVWFNALTALVVVATFFGYVPDQQVSETASNVLLALSPIVYIVLRLVTSKAVTF